MTVLFELDGHQFTALNGGPLFKFNESISFQVNCETQKEIDYYWEKLTAGGDPKAQQCGWLKDKYGLSMASRPNHHGRVFQEREFREVPTGDGSTVANEEARHRGTQESVR